MNQQKQIKTEKVQYWRNGIMLTAMMSKREAQQAVKDGRAYVITDQAIGAIINGKKSG